MYKKTITIFLIFLIAGVAFGSLTFEYFTGKTNAEGILLEWKTGDEGGVAKYEIERSASVPNNFVFIKTINASGNNSYYSFQDNGVDFKGKSGSSVYYYRLKCINSNASYSYTNTITVVHTVSGIKNTWGSIKAIFR